MWSLKGGKSKAMACVMVASGCTRPLSIGWGGRLGTQPPFPTGQRPTAAFSPEAQPGCPDSCFRL